MHLKIFHPQKSKTVGSTASARTLGRIRPYSGFNLYPALIPSGSLDASVSPGNLRSDRNHYTHPSNGAVGVCGDHRPSKRRVKVGSCSRCTLTELSQQCFRPSK
ncbi:hypothetical protein J6590_037664 [Homalodisca vitripennis]|nr:hypothetical protein J6590_037664 [Homalodisca vitripennis]